MSNILILLFIFQAKLIKLLVKFIKKGNATSLPGLLIELYFPNLINSLSTSYKQVIVVTGTNGKTTTRSILTNIYRQAGNKVCTNLGGANIYRGIAAALLLDKTLTGRTKSDILILEIEEATLPKIAQYLKVNKLILTNLFRDQLDLYGEIDKTLFYFQKSLEILDNSNLEVILNADDGKLTSLINYKLENGLKFKFSGFSLNLPPDQKPKFEEEAFWPEKYKNVLWEINPIFKLFPAENKNLKEAKSYFKITKSENNIFNNVSFGTNLEGNYNLYNCICAIIAAKEIGLDIIKNSLLIQTEVFGRGEEILVNNTKFKIILVKNPASFNLVLNSIASLNKPNNLIFLINDKIADGKDVSWLWDIEFEKFFLSNKAIKHNLLTGGSRGLDILLRLEYSGEAVTLENNFDSLERLLDCILSPNSYNNKKESIGKDANNNAKAVEYTVLATYTAMTEFREILATKVALKKINDENF